MPFKQRWLQDVPNGPVSSSGEMAGRLPPRALGLFGRRRLCFPCNRRHAHRRWGRCDRFGRGVHCDARQAKRNTALDLFKEYYSADFADERRKAERFMAKHANVDWSANDPYLLDETDTDLSGYSAVLRFWQRVATLHNEGEIPPGLIQRLLSRELGFWNAKLFQPMKARKGMYVRGPIVDLAAKFAKGRGRSAFEAGERDGKRAVPPELEGPGRVLPAGSGAAVDT